MKNRVKVTIIGAKNSYYVDTLENWFLQIKDIVEENLGKEVILELRDSEFEIPIILVNERKVFEGLPDNEGVFIEIILSNAK